MGRRTILTMVAIAIAALGSTLVFLYVQGINSRALEDQKPVRVLTATDTITAGESIDDAQAAGKLALTAMSRANVLPGALTTTAALKGELALTNIYQGEQILPEKFGATTSTSTLTIPKSDIAVSVQLNDPDRVAGFVTPGSRVAIFVTAGIEGQQAGGGDQGTRLLLSDVEVVGVGTTSLLAHTTTDNSGGQTIEQVPTTILTVALNQKDAERLIYVSRSSITVTFGLMSSASKVTASQGTGPSDLFR